MYSSESFNQLTVLCQKEDYFSTFSLYNAKTEIVLNLCSTVNNKFLPEHQKSIVYSSGEHIFSADKVWVAWIEILISDNSFDYIKNQHSSLNYCPSDNLIKEVIKQPNWFKQEAKLFLFDSESLNILESVLHFFSLSHRHYNNSKIVFSPDGSLLTFTDNRKVFIQEIKLSHDDKTFNLLQVFNYPILNLGKNKEDPDKKSIVSWLDNSTLFVMCYNVFFYHCLVYKKKGQIFEIFSYPEIVEQLNTKMECKFSDMNLSTLKVVQLLSKKNLPCLAIYGFFGAKHPDGKLIGKISFK